MAKMKIMAAGKHLWQRTLTSTVFGEAVDTVMFVPLAFGIQALFPTIKFH